MTSEAIDDIFGVVGDWGLEEKGEVGEDGSHWFLIDFNSTKVLGKEDHIDHEGGCEERIFADVVGGDSVESIHEYL